MVTFCPDWLPADLRNFKNFVRIWTRPFVLLTGVLALRNPEPNHGRWEEARRKEVAFGGADPTVLIIGGGQSGLEVAARLKALDVPALVIEKNERIGDNWRERYEALCLHDPVCKCCCLHARAIH